MNATVKEFKETIEQMRAIYNFDDEKTRLSTYNLFSRENDHLQLHTVDEKTGISVIMEKVIAQERKREYNA